jgi:adenosine deaminase
MDNWIADMPKIELHCHLDGSMGLDVTRELLAQRGEQYEIGELRQLLEAPMDCRSLAEYLEKFDLPIRCIQTEEGLRAAAYDLAASAAKEQVKYLEVRFAPSFSTGEGLSIVQILESVQAGLKEAEDEADIHTGIIVCGMRNLSMEENLSMLRAARELYGAGVVACDLAGDENAYPTAQFAEFFELAKKLGVPFTIHSGECGSTENIRTAIELGVSRLGHGIAMAKDPSLMAECAEKRIGVELCPTSNLQTKAVRSMEEYPFMQFFKAGIPLSVNTDNRTVSRTTCTAEAALLQRTYQLSPEDFAKIYRDSVEMSFATDEVKEILLKKYRKL